LSGMSHGLKIVLYVVLIASAIFFGVRFYTAYSKSAPSEAPVAQTEPSPGRSDAEGPPPSNDAAKPHAATGENNHAAEAAPPPLDEDDLEADEEFKRGESGGFMGPLAAFLAVLILLGLLAAHDISHYIGNRTVKFLFNDEGEGMKNPEYEQAEQTWVNGRPLEAIQMMRDYLKKNPREQYVALRIAEIYEKDLKNDLAAALEYEEVLKHKLPAERWGWAAIHLCNIYSKMGKTDEAVALLRRIDAEYGETAAANKARTRLALFDSVGKEALDGSVPEGTVIPPKPEKKTEASAPPSNLPRGFRPKK
jgi:TolA-binding protein